MLSTWFIYVVRFVCIKQNELRSIAFMAIEDIVNLYIVIFVCA